MTEAQESLALALKMYGEALVAYHATKDNWKDRTSFDNMCFWQEQVNHAAKDVAAEQAAQ